MRQRQQTRCSSQVQVWDRLLPARCWRLQAAADPASCWGLQASADPVLAPRQLARGRRFSVELRLLRAADYRLVVVSVVPQSEQRWNRSCPHTRDKTLVFARTRIVTKLTISKYHIRCTLLCRNCQLKSHNLAFRAKIETDSKTLQNLKNPDNTPGQNLQIMTVEFILHGFFDVWQCERPYFRGCTISSCVADYCVFLWKKHSSSINSALLFEFFLLVRHGSRILRASFEAYASTAIGHR